jgi:hypothetical protein
LRAALKRDIGGELLGRGVAFQDHGLVHHWRPLLRFGYAKDMANPQHVAKLNEGVLAWNRWRVESGVDIAELGGPILETQFRTMQI